MKQSAQKNQAQITALKKLNKTGRLLHIQFWCASFSFEAAFKYALRDDYVAQIEAALAEGNNQICLHGRTFSISQNLLLELKALFQVRQKNKGRANAPQSGLGVNNAALHCAVALIPPRQISSVAVKLPKRGTCATSRPSAPTLGADGLGGISFKIRGKRAAVSFSKQ